MRSLAACRFIVLGVFCGGISGGADWLSVRGDSQQTGFQPDEKVLSIRSVRKLQLLWTRRLNGTGDGLADPVMLGPIITDHGVKELVFTKDANTVYAVDADLGSVFWARTIGEQPTDRRSSEYCATGDRISPVMKPSSNQGAPASSTEDSYSDGNKPMYVIGSNGTVHVIRPRTGGDSLPPFTLLFPFAPVGLGIKNDLLYATSAQSCGGQLDRLWSKNIGASGLELNSRARSSSYIREQHLMRATFDLDGRTLGIEVAANGEPVLQGATTNEWLFGNANSVNSSVGVATWKDTGGERWIYTNTGESILAFQVKRRSGKPMAEAAWSLHGFQRCGPASIANGVVYFLSRSDGATSSDLVLHAVDARSGKELFNSLQQIANASSSGNLALANGHVCFTASEARLSCFGLPFTM